MKRGSSWAAIGLTALLAASAQAQTLSVYKLSDFYTQRADREGRLDASVRAQVQATDCTARAATTCKVSLWTTYNPVTFSRLDRVGGQWQVGPTMAIGESYLHVTGTATGQSDGSAKVDPTFLYGVAANLGVTPKSGGGLDASIMLGAEFGFSKTAFLIGYDVLLNRITFAIGTRVDAFPISAITKVVGVTR